MRASRLSCSHKQLLCKVLRANIAERRCFAVRLTCYNVKSHTDTLVLFDHLLLLVLPPQYSEKYSDGNYEYRHVFLPKDAARRIPKDRCLSEMEWRNTYRVTMSRGWEHYGKRHNLSTALFPLYKLVTSAYTKLLLSSSTSVLSCI
jgi:Cyclin-dependent kinase regulatory subunit